MSKLRKAINPFYGLLVVIGILFVVTVCAYFVMTLRDAKLGKAESNSPAHPLLSFIENHGLTVLTIELAVLAVATFGAIGTDDYWERRRRRQIIIDRESESGTAHPK